MGLFLENGLISFEALKKKYSLDFLVRFSSRKNEQKLKITKVGRVIK